MFTVDVLFFIYVIVNVENLHTLSVHEYVYLHAKNHCISGRML